MFAIAVLNDAGVNLDYLFNKTVGNKIVAMLDQQFGFFDGEQPAQFFPYWDNADVFRFQAEDRTQAAKGLHGSVFQRAGKAMLWLVNETDKGQTSDLWINDAKLLGKRAARLRDMETGEEMIRLPKTADAPTRDATWAHVHVPPHDFRALLLE